MKDAVLAGRADVGLAVDGDADRVGAMDADGSFVDSHRIFALVLRHLYEDKGHARECRQDGLDDYAD